MLGELLPSVCKSLRTFFRGSKEKWKKITRVMKGSDFLEGGGLFVI